VTLSAPFQITSSMGKLNLIVVGATDGVTMTVSTPVWRRLVDANDIFPEAITGSRIRDYTLTAIKINNNTLTIPVSAADNTNQNIAAGGNASVITINSGASYETDFIDINAAFKNNSGGTIVVDISIERGDGTVLRSYPSMTLHDGQLQPVFAQDQPTGNHSYRVMVSPVTAATIGRKVIEIVRHER
jgi:hypothetical protein